jgi:hypothetical protein
MQKFWSWDCSPQLPYYDDFWIIGHLIQGILPYMNRREGGKIFLFFPSVPHLAEHSILQRTKTAVCISTQIF